MSPCLSSMSTTCSSLVNSPRLLEKGPCSPISPMCLSIASSPQSRRGSLMSQQSRRGSVDVKGRARDGLMPCQRAQAARAQLSAKAGATQVDHNSGADEKSRFSFCVATIMATQRLGALTEARNAYKQKVASEARAKAFCQDIVAKLGEVKQTLRA